MEPALEMEFTAHFARRGGEAAARAAAAAVTGVIEAPAWFLASLLDVGRRVSRCLLARTAADVCRIVLTADRGGLALAGTDDTRITLHGDPGNGATGLPLLGVVDGLHVHRGAQGHVWVVWRGPWAPATDAQDER
ncbi:hypothetical protein [Streptomyces sp. S.PB5]|uniref:hypothetical protein n=1 Tax=Streptomyces sp. S.PB5 TaxID=3020844 RepID=UPI0025AFAA27|nr:hypothetical protein [Streptomyces sp. S.PB5]MDN3026791.1 hypothetical protein [Streptomyces sp. S.PB5]